jgi:hypothetical protein
MAARWAGSAGTTMAGMGSGTGAQDEHRQCGDRGSASVRETKGTKGRGLTLGAADMQVGKATTS